LRALIDTNVILDALLAREPGFQDAALLVQMVGAERIEGHVTANSVTDIAYILRKHLPEDELAGVLDDLIETFQVDATDKGVLRSAIRIMDSDLEDALQLADAAANSLDCIITNDKRLLKRSGIRALSPKEALRQL